MRLLLVALLAATALAGCFTGDADDREAGPAFEDPGMDGALPHGEGHEHADPDAHRHATNAALLDHMDLLRFGADDDLVVGAHAMDLHGDMLAVAVFGNHDASGGQQGFHLINVSDPEALQHVAFYSAGVPVRGDRTIAFSGDGQLVFLGLEGGPRPGISAVDVSDPTNPHEVGFWDDATGFGPHTVASGLIDGTQYVFALSLGVTILEWDGSAFTERGKYVAADNLALADSAGIIAQDPGSTYVATYGLRTLYGHDMNFYEDPATGTPLLLVAYAYDGLKILDLSAPEAPLLLARFLPEADTSHKHYVHSVTAERMEDGRLIVVAGSETFEDENQGIASPIWILDATDAIADLDPTGEPELLATWTNPSGAPAEALTQSVHFFRQQDGFLYLSHYHGGVWAFDLRTDEDRRAGQAFGFILPVPDVPVPPPEDCCIGFALGGIPMVFDVMVGPDHTVYAADIIQGVTSVRFDAPPDGTA